MAKIRVIMTVEKTVAVFNGTTMQAVIDWVKTNVVNNLPADATITISYEATP